MTVRWLVGDVRERLAELPDESVHCVVTSPPYWGLRDYGTAQWEGGDAGCDHVAAKIKGRGDYGYSAASKDWDSPNQAADFSRWKQTCPCGARRIDAQLGLEPTIEEHVAVMVEVFREVKRVLRSDGVLFLNYGDCYAGSPNGRSAADVKSIGNDDRSFRDKPFGTAVGGLKPKDLVMMPARIALALQADGWWLRSDIIWHKPNPMPESVTDRPTSAHEHVFLLAKSARYFWDAEAVREPHQEPWRSTGEQERGGLIGNTSGMRHIFDKREYNPAGRNCRNVWTIATAPFSAAHFATFPPELARRCIAAGTSERGACAKCGAPWVRVVERGNLVGEDRGGNYQGIRKSDGTKVFTNDYRPGSKYENTTTGWSSSCSCGADVVPAMVLDPFGGAGTVGLVADRMQRNAILIELSESYVELGKRRISEDAGPLLEAMQL